MSPSGVVISMNNQPFLPLLLLLIPMFCCLAVSETPSAGESGTGLEGVVTVGPVHGGPIRLNESDSKPLPNTDFVVKTGDITVTSFTTNDQGWFRVFLPPGHYTISKKDGKSRLGNYGPFEVDVAPGTMKKVEWKCDSGMR
jgi:hypothetical protein